jgi:hypothetical protein
VLSRLGLQVVLKSFYSPIPDLAALPDSTWERRSELAGIHFDLSEQLAFLERYRPFLAELAQPTANPSYPVVDAAVLHAIVRGTRPRRIVELGSGHSTLVAAEACLANEREGTPVDYRAYDPFPGVVRPRLPGLSELVPVRAEELPLALFEELAEGDILLVDTTHTVKTGGDVNHIVLDVLPRLRARVLVHFHDIFLPWEYPRAWFEQFHYYWAEQYLLQAFLAFNEAYEVLLPAQALARELPDRLGAVVPSFAPGRRPGSMWLIRR